MSEILIVHSNLSRELVGHANDVYMENDGSERKYLILGPGGEEDYELQSGDRLLVAGALVDPDALRSWPPATEA